MSGIHVGNNLNLCGDEYQVRVNSVLLSQDPVRPGNAVAISWNVVCSDPNCKVTLIGGTVGRVIPSSDYNGTVFDNPQVETTYTVTASAGGGTDQKSATVHMLPKSAFTFCLSDGHGGSSEITVSDYDESDAANQARQQCPTCEILPGHCPTISKLVKP
jgi:hypothetical protein